MREYTYKIDKAITSGLKPEERLKSGSPYMSQMQNLIPRAEGTSLYSQVTNPFSISPTVSYPFPQLFRGKEVTLLCFQTSIYEVTETAGAWTYSKITTYDYAVPASTRSIAGGGGIWHFVDFGSDSWFLYNGNEIVFKSRHLEFSGDASKVCVVYDVTMNTGCHHRGRHIVGGFNESDFWNSAWQTFFDTHLALVTAVNSDIPLDATLGLGQNFVYWSGIGGYDILGLLYPDFMIKGPTEEQDTADPLFLTLLERNDSGFVPMPFPGQVLCVKPLGDYIIVYQEDGITALRQVQQPTPTYGITPLKPFGIYERGAVEGDDFGHAFVDQSGDVWTIEPSLTFKRLGYKEFIGGMVGDSMLVTQDPLRKDFYISSDSDCYLLTSEGLGQTSELITSLHRAEGGLVGVSEALTGTRRDAIGVSDVIDMGHRGIKMIQSIEVWIETEDPVYAAVYYRHDKADSYTLSSYKILNKEGHVTIPVSGIDFKIALKVPYVDSVDWNVYLDYILVHWKAIDKRFRRGLSANENIE